MYQTNRVVACVPAGRRRFLDILSKYLDVADVVDEVQLWVNAGTEEDRRHIIGMAGGKYRLCFSNPHTGNPLHLIDNIHCFYEHACSPNTLYVRLDDDVVWIDKFFWEELLALRMKTDALLVSGSVINNIVCDWLRQRSGKLEGNSLQFDCMHGEAWNKAEWAERLHRRLLKEVRDPSSWKTQDWRMWNGERFSVNAICWRGEDMAEAVMTLGGVGVQEEAWLTEGWHLKTGREHVICGRALCAHYAFGPQREGLDKTDVLKQYAKLAEES